MLAACAISPAPSGSPEPSTNPSLAVTASAEPTASLEPTATPTPSPAPTASPTPRPTPYDASARVTYHPIGTIERAPLGYEEYLPPAYDDGKPLPLLVFLHGSGESGLGTAESLPLLDAGLGTIPFLIHWGIWPADRPFIVLAPQHLSRRGSRCMEASEIADFLRFAVRHYQVDRARVYLTGISCGAIGAWNYLGQATDDAVAAAVLIAGDGRSAWRTAGCALGRVAIWPFHGEADTVVTPAGSTDPLTKLRQCAHPAPVDARLTTFPGLDHPVWGPVYVGIGDDNIYDWLLSHRHRAALTDGK
jgi:predicted peptidase